MGRAHLSGVGREPREHLTMAGAWRAGDVVGIPYRGVRHEGIVTTDGDSPLVVHNSKRRGRVVEEPIEVFASGRPVSLVARAPAPGASVAFARAHVGAHRWSYADNCQTFTRTVSGTSIPSPDAHRAGWLAVAALAAAAFLGGRHPRR